MCLVSIWAVERVWKREMGRGGLGVEGVGWGRERWVGGEEEGGL